MTLKDDLEQISWVDVSHAYGPATDTPGQLLALLSDDLNAYKRALDSLWATICHQGTVYEASCAAIPFLITILRGISDERKPGLLYLLAGLTHRDQYAERDLPYLVIESTIERTHDESKYQFYFRQVWSSGARFLQDGNEFHDPRWMALAHAQVATGLPDCITLLSSDDRATVLATLHLLAAFREHCNIVAPAVDALLRGQTTDAFVEAEALLALGSVLPADSPLWERHIARLTSATSCNNPLTRYVAAVALAKHCPDRLPAPGLETLIGACLDPKRLNELREMLPSLEGRVSVHIEACQAICLLGSPTAVNTLATALDRGAERWRVLDTMRVAEALLDTAFFGGWVQERSWYAARGTPGLDSDENAVIPRSYHLYSGFISASNEFAIRCHGIEEEAARLKEQRAQTGLNADQRHALEAILHCEPFWQHRHNLLDMYGLPRERDAIKTLLATE